MIFVQHLLPTSLNAISYASNTEKYLILIWREKWDKKFSVTQIVMTFYCYVLRLFKNKLFAVHKFFFFDFFFYLYNLYFTRDEVKEHINVSWSVNFVAISKENMSFFWKKTNAKNKRNLQKGFRKIYSLRNYMELKTYKKFTHACWRIFNKNFILPLNSFYMATTKI